MMIRRRAFSLAELLIVISIIVLMIALAVPAFNFITGSKNQNSANNQIAAILGRARSEAIGLQEVRGVFFFSDPATGRYTAMLVRAPEFLTWVNGASYTVGQYVTNGGNYFVCIQDTNSDTPSGTGDNYWKSADVYAIDSILPDADSVTLPSGVALQLLCDGKVVLPASRATDGYLSAGAILFDANGRVVNRRISICRGGIVGQRMGMSLTSTENFPSSTSPAYPPATLYPFESSFGYVLYDHDAFMTQGFTDADYNVRLPQGTQVASYSGSPNERNEETWLDNNGYAVLVNRYNGSLIKSE